MTKLLTLKEIAKVLGVPESSLRKYREFFSAFIPSVGSGRMRRYRAESIEIFQDIRHLREEMHMPWDAVSDRLAEKYPIDATPSEPRLAPKPAAAPQTPQVTVHVEPEQAPLPLEPQVSLAAPAQQPQQPRTAVEPAAATGAAYLKKMAAISEKQMMIVNAMGLELMKTVEKLREESRQEIELMHGRMVETMNAMTRSVHDMSREEKNLLADVQNRLNEVRTAVSRVEKSGDRAVRLVEVEAQLNTVQRKLEQREKLIQEYKNSFEVLKRENTELRSFKSRHIDTAEERVREVKAMKKTPFMKKIFGPKI